MATRRSGSSPQLSPGQAAYVIERLIGERRVSAGDVGRYVDEMRREIDELEERLTRLRAAHGGVSSSSEGAGSAAPRRRGRPPGSGRKPGRPGRPPGRPPASAGASANAGAAGGRKRGRKRGGAALSPEQLASRQLQGRYLALVRRFPATRRLQFAKIAKEKGRESAIREMQSSLDK